MKTLYFDCGMGDAGDMLTAALYELHPEPREFLARLNFALGGKAVVSADKCKRCGVAATHMRVDIEAGEERPRTSVSELKALIASLPLSDRVKGNALAVYGLIAEAESAVHGVSVENIHFHELGSLDALADVLAVCMLIDDIRPDKIIASPLNVGGGTVKCAHGILPVPAPATELLLRGAPIYSGDIKLELCTPTGAALLRYFADSFGDMPQMRVENVGCGAGSRELERANIVRALLGETEDEGSHVAELCCNIDDMTAEELGFAQEELFRLGALDVYTTNIGMKKCRPAVMLSCVCRLEDREKLLEGIFRHTSTLGVREYTCRRYTLRRGKEYVDTEFGRLGVKTAESGGLRRAKPEYEDAAAAAREHGVPLREVSAAAMRAFEKDKKQDKRGCLQ